MSHDLKVGDRVRITSAYHGTDYLPGEIGEVRAGPETVADDPQRYYLVAIYKWGTTRIVVFAEDEIEPDI